MIFKIIKVCAIVLVFQFQSSQLLASEMEQKLELIEKDGYQIQCEYKVGNDYFSIYVKDKSIVTIEKLNVITAGATGIYRSVGWKFINEENQRMLQLAPRKDIFTSQFNEGDKHYLVSMFKVYFYSRANESVSVYLDIRNEDVDQSIYKKICDINI